MIFPLIFKALTPKMISENVPFQRFVVTTPRSSSVPSPSKATGASSQSKPFNPATNGGLTYDKSVEKIFHSGGFVIKTAQWDAVARKSFEVIEPEYELIDSLEEKGDMAKADERIMNLWNESYHSKDYVPYLGLCTVPNQGIYKYPYLATYLTQMVYDLEQRGQFAELFQFCYKFTKHNTIPVRDSVYVLEAICGAHIGLVFKGERAFLRRVGNEELGENEAKKWDRGNDPKSIELFASMIYARIGGEFRKTGDVGCDNGVGFWALNNAYRLDPTNKELIIGWAFSNYALDPAKYQKVLQDNFPHGFASVPNPYATWADLTVAGCKAMIYAHHVYHPKYLPPRFMVVYKSDHAQKP